MVDTNPYLSWLNVEYVPGQSTAYQLLALTPLESNTVRIRLAFEKQEAALSRIAEQADPAQRDRVARELQAAFELLSDPARKAVLDASIQRKAAATPSAHAAANAPPVAVTCPRCQRSNPSSRRFCGSCGQSLWEKCPKCGGECSADDRFCGTCGTDVAAGFGEQERDCERRLDEAAKFLAGHHYDSALRTLRSVAATSDPRLERFATRALAQIEQVEEARRAAASTAGEAVARAEKYLAAYAYERAIEVLQDVPGPLRHAEHVALLDRALACRNEILALSGEIRQAVEQRKVWEVSQKLERLLALSPQHAQARQLAEQLREHFLKNAKARLKEFRYRDALHQVERIPDVVSNEAVKAVRDTAAELTALSLEVHEGALADKAHAALAERLCRVAPGDPQTQKRREELATLTKKPPANPRFGAPNASVPPKRTVVGPPIDWLAHFGRALPADNQVAAALRAHPGQFFTAFGLALQGLGLASLDADLTPRPSRGGVLNALAPLSLGRRPASTAWGIDLSDCSLKAIQLVAGGRNGVTIKAARRLAVANLGEQDAVARAEQVQGLLAEFAAGAGDLKGMKVCVDFPDQRVLGRFFELPPMPAKKLADSIQYEVKHQIPISLEELCWSHAVLGPLGEKSPDGEPRRLMVQAARETSVRDRIGRFKEVGIAVDIVQSSAVALHNALRFEFPPSDEPWGKMTLAAVDVGSTTTNVVISSPSGVWFRTFGHGGELMTRELVRQLRITYDQAAQLFREPWRGRRFSHWIRALQPMYVQFASEISRSIATYQRLWPDQPVQHVLGLGGAFPAIGLLRYLRTGQ